MIQQRAIFGILTRRERWGLSARGCLVVILAGLLLSWVVVVRIHPFLAVTDRVEAADALVVEGWIHEYAIQSSVDEFKSRRYVRIFSTGGPIEGMGGYTSDNNTWASVGARMLRKTGLAGEYVQMVPSRVSGRDRTYSSAVALRNWLREHDVRIRGINVVTEDLHARRTRLLFEKAVGNTVRVGVIAVPNPDYDANHWWQYSEGVRPVIAEGTAYLYARILFHRFAD